MRCKAAILLMAVILAFMKSCSLGGVIVLPNNGKIIDDKFEQFVDAIKAEDRSGIKSLFSANAINQNAELDEQIDLLLGFIEGEIDSWERTGGPGASQGNNDDGSGRSWKELRATYDITTSEQKYHVSLLEVTKHTLVPDSVGVSTFCIINAKVWDEEFNYWGDLGDPKDFITRGIVVNMSKDGVPLE